MEFNIITGVYFPWPGPSLRRQIRSVSPRGLLLTCSPPTAQLARTWLGAAGVSHALSHCLLSLGPPLPGGWDLASIPGQIAGRSPFCNLY